MLFYYRSIIYPENVAVILIMNNRGKIEMTILSLRLPGYPSFHDRLGYNSNYCVKSSGSWRLRTTIIIFLIVAIDEFLLSHET